MVVKGQAYGIRSIRVDGNDALAVYSTIRAARQMVVQEQKPVLVEVKYMTTLTSRGVYSVNLVGFARKNY